MMAVWITFGSLETLDKEIDSVLWRNQIEEEHFKVAFFEELHEDVKRKLLERDYYEKEGRKFNIKQITKEVKGLEKRIRMK